jgi:hypothetical protein
MDGITGGARRATGGIPSSNTMKGVPNGVNDKGRSSEGKKETTPLITREEIPDIFRIPKRENPVGELLRREGIYFTDLTRIRQKVREGVLERLADGPGTKKETVSQEDCDALKREHEEKDVL